MISPVGAASMTHIVQPPLIAQTPISPTLQRLQQLEQADRAARDAKAKNWRTFPVGAAPVLAPSLEPFILFVEACSYYWPGWKLNPATGIRHTQMRCNHSLLPYVAVNCSTLRLTAGDFWRLSPATTASSPVSWSGWRLPADLGEKQLVAALCDNI